MKKKFLLPIIIFTAVSFVGCNVDPETFKDTTKREAYEKTEIKKKLKEFEDKIGLENLSERPVDEMFKVSDTPSNEFTTMRGKKIKKELLTKETIYQVIGRAKYLANSIDADVKDRDTIFPAYLYMDGINKSDYLGNFLSKDLALELLSDLFEFGDTDSVIKLIENKDDKMYEYNYLSALLLRYFISTDDFDISEKKVVMEHLGNMSSLSFYYQSDTISSTVDVLKEEWVSNYKGAKIFLEKEYIKN